MARLVRLPFGMRYLIHTPGIIASGFVFFLWTYVHIFNFVPIVIPRYQDGSLSLFTVAIYVLLSFNTLIAFFRTMISDPGRVLDVAEEKIDWTYWEKCPKCVKPRPPRSHHCQKCGHCVLKMDHHCIWTNNCIGVGNIWIFITLLFYAFAFSCLNTIIYIGHIWQWMSECSTCNKIPWINSSSTGIQYLSYMFIIMMVVGTGLLLLTQYINVIHDKTTIENLSESNSFVASGKRPDWKSVLQSFSNVCGTTKMLWWISCRKRPYPLTNSTGLNTAKDQCVV